MLPAKITKLRRPSRPLIARMRATVSANSSNLALSRATHQSEREKQQVEAAKTAASKTTAVIGDAERQSFRFQPSSPGYAKCRKGPENPRAHLCHQRPGNRRAVVASF
jgi:hypothetical protein